MGKPILLYCFLHSQNIFKVVLTICSKGVCIAYRCLNIKMSLSQSIFVCLSQFADGKTGRRSGCGSKLATIVSNHGYRPISPCRHMLIILNTAPALLIKNKTHNLVGREPFIKWQGCIDSRELLVCKANVQSLDVCKKMFDLASTDDGEHKRRFMEDVRYGHYMIQS